MIYDDLTVYVRDGWSKVVRRAEPGIVSAVMRGKVWEPVWSDPCPDPADEGWVPVKKGVRDSLDGWTYAALNHSALPADYDNRFKARPIESPRTLYRAVSLGEMADIVSTGAVSGGGNGFHGFDSRPFVFFSDAITPRVIHQGEEIDRSLGHQMQLQFKELQAAFDGYMEEMEHEARNALRKAAGNLSALSRTRVLSEMDPSVQVPQAFHEADQLFSMLSRLEGPIDWNEFRDPRSRSFRDARRLHIVPGAESDRILREFQDARHAIKEEFQSTYRQRYEQVRREREAMSFTSALIETRPIGLGFHFSKRFWASGMGDEDEYGLFPRQVRADDIKHVLWVKDGIVVDETSLDAAADVLERLKLERESINPAEEMAAPAP